MSELEQLMESALVALMHYPLMDALEKARLCSRLERMASNAYDQFMTQSDKEEEARDEAA